MMSSPPGCFLNWTLTPGDIETRTSTLIETLKSFYDQIGKIELPTFESLVLPLALFEAECQVEKSMLDFYQYVSPDQALRDASCESTRKISDVEVELEMNKDVFDKFVLVEPKLDSSVSPEFRRYVERKIKLGRRNGLHLSEDVRNKIEQLSKTENQLSIDFSRALNEENTMLEFTDEELAGCPDEFIQRLKKLPSGKREVTLKYPDYFPASEKASVPETRKKLENAFNSRCKEENIPVLRKLMSIRKERSEILGFPTHGDFVLEMRMAKNTQNVDKFLNNIGEKLRAVRAKETERLLQLKKEECQRLGIEYVDRLEPWDVRYYINMAKEKDYKVDQQVLQKYFPLSVVKAGILRLYQHLLHLKFERVTTTNVWHPEVEMYAVTDANSNNLMGYFYLDLHPRQGKYGHAAVFDLQPSCLRKSISATGESESTTSSQLAVCAMVANFTAPPSPNEEAYLLHSEVEVFFHEFGHVMHHICSSTETAMFSGTHVETDFVECPSQMLENWVWNADGLNALLGNETKPIPKELMDRLIESRFACSGLFYCRQVLLSSFDQAIHTTRWADDPMVVFTELSKKWIDITPSPGTCMPASFNHLAGGYDARYYSYLWSEVFSADLFETRFRHAPDGGCLSRTVGLEYRNKILKPGGSRDAIDSLCDFLGREPNDQAFFGLLSV